MKIEDLLFKEYPKDKLNSLNKEELIQLLMGKSSKLPVWNS